MTEPTPTDPPGPSIDAGPEPHPDDVRWAARLHDLTHEAELIISAGLLFGLFQVPGRINGLFDAAQLGLVGPSWTVAFVLWYYTTLIVYTLIGAFGVHIVARMYWIGLIGLDSAFPRGILWDQLKYGRRTKAVYRARLWPVPTLARKVDRFCSSIFAVAFWIVALFAFSVVLAGVVGVVALGATRWVVPALDTGLLWLGIMLALSGSVMAAVAFDRYFGDRLPDDGRTARFVQRVIHVSGRVAGGRLVMPTQLTLFSNLSQRVMTPIYALLLFVLLAAFMVGEGVRSGRFVVSATEVWPVRPGFRSVDAGYYADTRSGAAENSSTPFIQSEIVTDPYVRLEVPLVARRHLERLDALCPALVPIGRRGLAANRATAPVPDRAATEAALACTASLFAVTLDGAPVEVSWDFRSRPGRGVTGLVGYIATERLAPGAHTLHLVEVVPEDDEEADAVEEGDGEEEEEEEPTVRQHFIRFRT